MTVQPSRFSFKSASHAVKSSAFSVQKNSWTLTVAPATGLPCRSRIRPVIGVSSLANRIVWSVCDNNLPRSTTGTPRP